MFNYSFGALFTEHQPPPRYVVEAAQIILGQTRLNEQSTGWQESEGQMTMTLAPQNTHEASVVIAMHRLMGSKGHGIGKGEGFWVGMTGSKPHISPGQIGTMMVELSSHEPITPVQVVVKRRNPQNMRELDKIRASVISQLSTSARSIGGPHPEKDALLAVVEAGAATPGPDIGRYRGVLPPEEAGQVKKRSAAEKAFPAMHVIMGMGNINTDSSGWETTGDGMKKMILRNLKGGQANLAEAVAGRLGKGALTWEGESTKWTALRTSMGVPQNGEIVVDPVKLHRARETIAREVGDLAMGLDVAANADYAAQLMEIRLAAARSRSIE